ncbi:MAG TPA: reverse transcriptase family protein [Polyangiaceae bacterium]|nr:reverse transcriptase family protein [Polyangiaceae bacterium]
MPVPQGSPSLPAPKTAAASPALAAAPAKPSIAHLPDPYEAKDILGLGAEELRKRALRINPFRTAWIGRVDTIPPQSDERTAIIDRGLILRGLLSAEQIREIHRVGDQWQKHHDAIRIAETRARGAADQVIAEQRAANAAKKAEKQAAAASRREALRAAIAERKATDIVFAGRGVSHKLGDRRSNVEALTKAGLPVLSTPAQLARALGLEVPALRWLTYHHESLERTHYVYFEIPKRSGGMRLLASPKQHLRRAQRWVLSEVLSKLEVTPQAHGFVAQRSTVTNALPHVGCAVIVNQDLADFFPSVTFPRVRGLFESLGYSPAVATLLALLCTESSRAALELDGRKHWVAVRERALPQGACTSPIISNLVARKLDRRLLGASRKLGFAYTRYADDLTFSSQTTGSNVGLLLARVRHIVEEEGFAINPKKGRVQRRNRRQDVTGVVVNDKLGPQRSEFRKLRAILHNAKKTGLAAQNREQHPHFEAWLRGKIGYVMMLDAEKGRALAEALAAVDEG